MKKYIHTLFVSFLFVGLFFQVAQAQPDWKRVNYETSTIFTGIVTVDGAMAQTSDIIGIFVDDECRMLANIIHVNGKSYVSAVIHSDFDPEKAIIKYWNSHTNTIHVADTFLTVTSHGAIKEFPIEIKSEEVPQEPTFVNNIEQEQRVTVFPSPFTNVINVTASSQIQRVAVFNTIGNMLLELDNIQAESTIIESSGFSNGFYLVQVELSDGSIVTEKVVKR